MRIDKATRQTAGFFLLLEALLFYLLVVRRRLLFGGPNAASIGTAAGLALVLVLASPRLRPVFAAILRASQVVGRLVYGLITALVFLFILTPIGLIQRIFRRTTMDLRGDPGRTTYYERWEPSEDVRKQY